MIEVSNKQIIIITLMVVFVLGCGRTQGRSNSDKDGSEKMSKEPSITALTAITAPTYRKPVGTLQECLGRLVFEIGANAEWPTFYNGADNFSRSFSADVFNSADVMNFGSLKIAVFYASNASAASDVKRELPSLTIQRLEGYIKEAREFISELESGSRVEANSDWAISRKISAIEGWEKEISRYRTQYFEFSPDVPGGEGYGRLKAGGGSNVNNYSVYRAFITHGKHISMFESTRSFMEMDKEAHAQEFVKILKNFRPRNENEIPSELGICIPYGFIQDDGRTLVDIRQSFRMPDAPGVLYTIHTGSSQRLRRSSAREATSFASVGKMGTEEDLRVAPFITQRIEPRPYKIGGMTAIQGGVAAKIVKAGTPSYETYQVFTGYSGWPGAEALPFIFVELNTTTMFTAKELKQNPPPFKQSWGRLESLLKSVRLRPTSPTMPDFVDAGVK